MACDGVCFNLRYSYEELIQTPLVPSWFLSSLAYLLAFLMQKISAPDVLDNRYDL